MTVDEFLDHLGGEVEERLELIDGIITAMVGGTLGAGVIAGNVFAALRAKLRGGRCRVFGDNVLLRTGLRDAFSPDAMVVCGDVNLRDRYASDPTLVVEVLSPSTEAHDRGYKWSRYQSIPSLRYYLMITQESYRVEVYSREQGGRWVYEAHDDFDRPIALPALGIELTLGEIYEGVEPAAPEPPSTVEHP